QILGNSISRTGRVLQTNPDPSAQGGIMCNAVGEGLVIAHNLVEDINIGPGIGLSTHLSTSNGEALIANNVIGDVAIHGNFFRKSAAYDMIFVAANDSDRLVCVEGNYFKGTSGMTW